MICRPLKIPEAPRSPHLAELANVQTATLIVWSSFEGRIFEAAIRPRNASKPAAILWTDFSVMHGDVLSGTTIQVKNAACGKAIVG